MATSVSRPDPVAGLWDSRLARSDLPVVSGYASSPSVGQNEMIHFQISCAEPGPVVVAVHRAGWYGGIGTTLVHTGPELLGSIQSAPRSDPETGLLSCDWSSSWALTVPPDWTSGLYIAEFAADGARAFTPFVVRDDKRRADLCVVLPFATYQAENLWSADTVSGKSLSQGYRNKGLGGYSRAAKVSFDRPFAGDGLPDQIDSDRWTVAWIEEQQYDAVYVTDIDLHAGRVDPSTFAGVVFPGATTYWSIPMRDALARALAHGTSAAFLSARNIYWHVRLEASADGRRDRVLVCYKDRPDPDPRDGMATIKWRIASPGPGQAEQQLLGTQFVAEVPRPTPLVVSGADHWFWSGTGVRDGDEFPDLVAHTADGHDQRYPSPPDRQRTLLASSPLFFTDQGEQRIHHTSICEASTSTLVFAAGTPQWPRALGDPRLRDERIRAATANLVERMLLAPLLADQSRRASVSVENLRRGSGLWRVGADNTRATTASQPEIEAYACATSVTPGSRLDFRIRSSLPFTVAVHRIGHYAGLGSRLVAESGQLPAVTQPACLFDERTRSAACDWASTWQLDVREGFTSGIYVAAFTTDAGHRALTPFVVTDPSTSARICVVIPFLTYQANNRWPLDGVHGTSLAFGYITGTSAGSTFRTRALEVSFDRPFTGTGLPQAMMTDIDVIDWLERHGYDVTYVADQDVHSGQVDVGKFGGLLFLGQHEYWTRALRERVARGGRRASAWRFSVPPRPTGTRGSRPARAARPIAFWPATSSTPTRWATARTRPHGGAPARAPTSTSSCSPAPASWAGRRSRLSWWCGARSIGCGTQPESKTARPSRARRGPGGRHRSQRGRTRD